MKREIQKFGLSVSAVSLMALVTACGGSQNLSTVKAPSESLSVTPAPLVNPATPVVPTSLTGSNLLPPITPPIFDIRGHLSSTQTQVTYNRISTDTTLKVTLLPDSSGYVDFSNQSVGFNCLKFNVTVRPQGSASTGWSKQVLASTNGKPGTGSCQGAQVEPTLDFSEYMTPGHGEMEVTVALDKSANTDNCRTYHWNHYYSTWIYGAPTNSELNYNMVSNPVLYGIAIGGCKLDVFYANHHATGKVLIHVDGTS